MTNLNITNKQFLSAFFKDDDTVFFRAFSDNKSNGNIAQIISSKLSDIDGVLPRLTDLNSKKCGIFFVINSGGNNDQSINRINSQFVENDNLSLEEQYQQLIAFPLEPSIIVQTRKSLHSYWLIKDGTVSKFRDIQTRLADFFDGDRTIKNESRVLRVPGFYHQKSEPVMVTCIKFNPELRYTQEQLLEHLPQITADVSAKSTSFYKNDSSSPILNKGLDRVLKNCDFIKHCRENAYDLPEHDWYSMISNLAVFEGGSDEIHRISRPYPHYSFDETEEKIGHFIQSGTKPINCSTIAEKGYKCPKRLNGECSCKSPAGIAFMPLSIDELSEILNKLEITNQKVRDIDTASKFISQHLCNVDELIALSFISYNIKEKFRFDINDIRLLKKKYKELSDIRNRDNDADSNALPDWYEQSTNGVWFLPKILAEHLSSNEKVIYAADNFYQYTGGVYSVINSNVANRIISSKLTDRHTRLNDILDCQGQWKIAVHRDVNIFNPDPFTINLKNGLFDINTKSLAEHTPEYLSTVQIKAKYDPNAECPRFLQFLNETLEPDDIQIVQEILGYLLIPLNRAQKAFVFVGPGQSGKSTLLSVAQELLLGPGNVSNVPWQSLGDRFNTAVLFNKLANVFSDLPSKSIEDNGLFKSITGEDIITVEEKHKAPFSFKPFAKLLFSCNEIPRNCGDKSNAFLMKFAESLLFLILFLLNDSNEVIGDFLFIMVNEIPQTLHPIFLDKGLPQFGQYYFQAILFFSKDSPLLK